MVLKKLKITSAQYFLLHCLYYKRYTDLVAYRDLFPIEDEDEKYTIIGKYSLNDLVERNLIVEIKSSTPPSIVNYQVTEQFRSVFVVDVIAFEEVKNAYPEYLVTNNKRFPLFGGDEEILTKVYYEKIKGALGEHIEVLEDIKFMVDNRLTSVGLEAFIRSKGWLPIRKQRSLAVNNSEKLKRKSF